MLHVCMYTTCMSGTNGGQKKASNLSGLDLQMVMNYYVGAVTELKFSARTNVLNC